MEPTRICSCVCFVKTSLVTTMLWQMQCFLSSTSIVCRSKWPLTYFPRHVWPPNPQLPFLPLTCPWHPLILKIFLHLKKTQGLYCMDMHDPLVTVTHVMEKSQTIRLWHNRKPQIKKGSVMLSFFCLFSQRAAELMLCSWGPLSRPNVCAARGSWMDVAMDRYIGLANIWPFRKN